MLCSENVFPREQNLRVLYRIKDVVEEWRTDKYDTTLYPDPYAFKFRQQKHFGKWLQ